MPCIKIDAMGTSKTTTKYNNWQLTIANLLIHAYHMHMSLFSVDVHKCLIIMHSYMYCIWSTARGWAT